MLSAADVSSIHQLVADDIAAVRSGDWDALALLFTEDAVRMPPEQEQIRGRDAIRASMHAISQVYDFTVEVEELDGADDVAYLLASYRFTLSIDGSEPLRDAGRLLAILKREPDGSWLWARDMWHSDAR